MFEVRPDTKGPKNIGTFMMIGGLVLLAYAYANFTYHTSDMSENDVEILLKNSNRQSDENTTVEDYREFEQSSQEESSFLFKAIGLGLAGLTSIIGGSMLRSLNPMGSKIAGVGVGLGACIVFITSYDIYNQSRDGLNQSLQLTYLTTVYLWSTFLGLCFAISVLPLLNVRARLAMNPDVRLAGQDEES
ncbi:MAG: hypothetical protein VW270_14510 [Candidatus Poseidoniales archaeon]